MTWLQFFGWLAATVVLIVAAGVVAYRWLARTNGLEGKARGWRDDGEGE